MSLYKKFLPIIFISFSVFFLTGCDKKEVEEKIVTKEKNVTVNVHTLKKQTYPLWIDFSGRTEASKKVELTSRVQGELQKIFFKAGDEVKKGQVLFQIDDSQYRSILEQKEATLEKNRSSLYLAMANVRRYTPLINKGLAPKEKLDELEATQKQMQAIVNVDAAAIKQARLDVSYTTIKSTIEGQIGKPLIDIGNFIKASNTTLAHIISAKTLFVNFLPSANEVSLIKKYKSELNPKVIIKPENSGKELELSGNIDFIDNTSNESTGTVAMRAKIDNKNNLLFAGTFVEIKLFLTDKLEFIAIPPNSVSQNQLGSYVFVVDTENKIQTRQIKISYSNKDLTIVKEGLKTGDKLVLSAINRLKNNQIVDPIEIKNPIKR